MTDPTEAARQEMDALANRFFDAVERADIDALEQTYAPNVEYWMNVTRQSQGLDALLHLARLFSQKVKGLHYVIESRDFFPGGFVQRCRITGELASGEALDVPLCLVIHVGDGRIVRLYEYIDAGSIVSVFA
jgi:ketosteroid isomerase-like protein